jgi:hypothetical protein
MQDFINRVYNIRHALKEAANRVNNINNALTGPRAEENGGGTYSEKSSIVGLVENLTDELSKTGNELDRLRTEIALLETTLGINEHKGNVVDTLLSKSGPLYPSY